MMSVWYSTALFEHNCVKVKEKGNTSPCGVKNTTPASLCLYVQHHQRTFSMLVEYLSKKLLHQVSFQIILTLLGLNNQQGNLPKLVLSLPFEAHRRSRILIKEEPI